MPAGPNVLQMEQTLSRHHGVGVADTAHFCTLLRQALELGTRSLSIIGLVRAAQLVPRKEQPPVARRAVFVGSHPRGVEIWPIEHTIV